MRTALCALILLMPTLSWAATPQFASSFSGFETEASFLKYLKSYQEEQTFSRAAKGGGGSVNYAPAPSAVGSSQGYGMGSLGDMSAEAAPANTNITNNQEQGVDEGGIVKNIGNALVILRQGRLYAVDLDKQGQAKLTDSMRVAPDEALNQDVWYDEMLVKGDMIYVIGYRYVANVVNKKGEPVSEITGATEYSSFRLKGGKLTRLKSTFFESNDYYSGENYASRMLGDRIVTYMPFYVDVWADRPTFPRVLSYHGSKDPDMAGTFKVEKPIFDWRAVLKPTSRPSYPTFLTVMSCTLPKDGSLNCKAKSLLDDWYGEMYVSGKHIFLWGEGRVAAFKLDTLQAATHRTEGYPTNQFAFSEREGVLRVVVTDDNGKTKVLRLPLNKFAAHHKQKDLGAKQLLEENGYITQQRWVGNWYLGGIEDGEHSRLLGYNDDDRSVRTTAVDGWVQKVEAMPGVGALVVVSKANGVVLQTAQLQGAMELIPAYEFEGAQVSEWRSHGFFFQPNTHGGIFGLPVVQEAGGQGYWGASPSSISFFGVQKSGLISRIGQISASEGAETQCETSCIDWYGNTRPIFMGGRIFALMGSELSEASILVSKEGDNKTKKKWDGPAYHLREHGKRVALTFKQAELHSGE